MSSERNVECEIYALRQMIGQLAFCLAAACQGSPSRVGLLVDKARAISSGVRLPALEEPTPAWRIEFGRRVLAITPDAVLKDGKWRQPDAAQ